MAKKIIVKNPIDFLISQARNEVEIAETIVEEIRNKKDLSESERYYQEKIALKMLDFMKEEERMILIYAEAKQNYPILADLMENKRPYLKEMLAEAKRLFEKKLLGN
jgi:hypothetical protein